MKNNLAIKTVCKDFHAEIMIHVGMRLKCREQNVKKIQLLFTFYFYFFKGKYTFQNIHIHFHLGEFLFLNKYFIYSGKDRESLSGSIH